MTVSSTTGWDVLDRAHEALRAAVAGVSAQAWDAPTPCEQWNVTQVLQHAAGDQLAWAAPVSGGPGPAENPFTPSGKLADAPLTVVDEALRGFAYAPPLDPEPGDDEITALLRYLGRSPDWAS
jgi:Mycothiol maleylpyruvate isomerase N-terminal domain